MKLIDNRLCRRGLLIGLGATGLSACHWGKKDDSKLAARSASGLANPAASLQAVVDGAWRAPADRARDRWRHPVDSLTFWGLKPGMTVAEFWPGAGWYTDILAPYLAQTGGTLYAVNVEPASPAAAQMVDVYRRRLEARPALYGKVQITAFGATSSAVAPAGSCDMVLFLRNLHDWMHGGIAEKAFHEAFQALKPGGVLGIEEHRATPGGVQDVLATNGYVQEAYVQQMAKEAGFRFEAASEISANPKDSRDHPFGVWTLPPTLRTAPDGQPPNPKFDTAPYQAIGESDRMTLRFRKPK
ncbi:MAG: methyltransferase domain-containing protein [Caulobacteraceae bacterium]|nr:methyltransferase domain-containing protein [Caulobacteraceae bacterium]